MGVLEFLESGSPNIVDSNGQVLINVPTYVDGDIPATADNGLLNVGPGPWDGTSAGHFTGLPSGTGLAMNLPSGSGADLLHLQIGGSDILRLTAQSYLYLPGEGLGVTSIQDIQQSGTKILLYNTITQFSIINAGNPGIDILAPAGQTARLTGWQVGNVRGAAMDQAARLTVPGLGTPTIATGAQGTGAALDAGASDQRGGITVSSTATAGTLCTITFNAAWGAAPLITLTARNAASVGTLYYTSTTTGFTVSSTLATVQALSFSYICMG